MATKRKINMIEVSVKEEEKEVFNFPCILEIKHSRSCKEDYLGYVLASSRTDEGTFKGICISSNMEGQIGEYSSEWSSDAKLLRGELIIKNK